VWEGEVLPPLPLSTFAAMNDDDGTSCRNARASNRSSRRAGFRLRHVALYFLGAWLAGTLPVAATLQEYGSVHSGNQVTVRRQIVIKRGTWPVTTSFEYHNGVNWVNIGGVGPGKTDMVLDYNGSTYAISKSMSGTKFRAGRVLYRYFRSRVLPRSSMQDRLFNGELDCQL
jgi:hypothetical protein